MEERAEYIVNNKEPDEISEKATILKENLAQSITVLSSLSEDEQNHIVKLLFQQDFNGMEALLRAMVKSYKGNMDTLHYY